MDMAAAAKRIRSGDVMRALDSGEFDDIVVPELDDSCSDGEEPVTSDVVINGDAKLDICDVVRQSSSCHLDPCFRESVLLGDVELDNSSDVSDNVTVTLRMTVILLVHTKRNLLKFLE